MIGFLTGATGVDTYRGVGAICWEGVNWPCPIRDCCVETDGVDDPNPNGLDACDLAACVLGGRADLGFVLGVAIVAGEAVFGLLFVVLL